MPKFDRLLAITMLGVCLGCKGGVLGIGGGDKVTLRLKPAKGAKLTYETTTGMKQAMGSQNMDSTSTMTVTYQAVSSDPQGTNFHVTIDDIKMDAAGNPLAAGMAQQMKGKSYDITYDDHGRGKAATGAGSMAMQMSSGAAAGAGFLGIEFPDTPVGAGSTWSASIDLGKMTSGMAPGVGASGTIPVNYKVDGITDSGGKKLVNVGYTVKGAADMTAMGQKMTLQMDMTGTISVDASTGAPVSETLNGTNTIQAGGRSMTQQITTTTKLKS